LKNNIRFFTVGPAAICSKASGWTTEFFELGLGSVYHRSDEFHRIYKKLDKELRTLMNIPNSHAIFIASSGSEIMERILQNCVRKESFHFVNGSFSKKFYNYAQRLRINASKLEVKFGTGFNEIPNISRETELICITHNETSTGIKTTENFIHEIGLRYPDKILAIDTVSSAPLVRLDFSLVDICFFSSQKAFGLPAGLGIFIINLNLAQKLAKEELNLGKGAHNTLSDYLSSYEKFQTPSTPNVMGVYLMSKVAEDMNLKGRDQLFSELLTKKEKLHSLFTSNPYLKLVNGIEEGSDTVIVTEFIQAKSLVNNLLRSNHIICSLGYGEFAETQLRFSNFPANTMEDIHYLEKVLMS
jgi:phosphoserine aminotransferase